MKEYAWYCEEKDIIFVTFELGLYLEADFFDSSLGKYLRCIRLGEL